MAPKTKIKGNVFTPLGRDGARMSMTLSNEDIKKCDHRGEPWSAKVTDLNSGIEYEVKGAPCNLPGCFCDAVVVFKDAMDRGLQAFGLLNGETEIWYMKHPIYHDSAFAMIDPSDLGATHVKLGNISATDLNEAYETMQGHTWSPVGKAREFIKALGICHTSMSIGDVIRTEKGTWMVAGMGFKEFGKRAERKPAFENDACRHVGLMATCNACDRIIWEDEDWMGRYAENAGYCRECDEETNGGGHCNG